MDITLTHKDKPNIVFSNDCDDHVALITIKCSDKPEVIEIKCNRNSSSEEVIKVMKKVLDKMVEYADDGYKPDCKEDEFEYMIEKYRNSPIDYINEFMSL